MSRGVRAVRIAHNSTPRVSRQSGWCRRLREAGRVGRGHFARFLVEQSYVRNTKAAFKKYLGTGRPGYVAHRWSRSGDAIGLDPWRRRPAVLAHPDRYRLAPLRMNALFDEFRQRGGEAVEISGADVGQIFP